MMLRHRSLGPGLLVALMAADRIGNGRRPAGTPLPLARGPATRRDAPAAPSEAAGRPARSAAPGQAPGPRRDAVDR